MDSSSRCLITVMDKWAKRAFLRVVGGVSTSIYVCTKAHISKIYAYTHTCTYIHIYIHKGIRPISYKASPATLVLDFS